MVEANSEAADAGFGNSEEARQQPLNVMHAVAESYDRNAGLYPYSPADRRHWIRVVEKVSIRTQLGKIFGDRDHLRDHTHGARDTTRHHGIANWLVDSMLSWNLNINLPASTPAHSDGSYDKVRTRQDFATVRRTGDRKTDTLECEHLVNQPLHSIQRDGIDIYKR